MVDRKKEAPLTFESVFLAPFPPTASRFKEINPFKSTKITEHPISKKKVYQVAFNSNGNRLLTASSDATIRMLNFDHHTHI